MLPNNNAKMNLENFINRFGFNPVTEWDLPPYAKGWDFDCNISGGEQLCKLYSSKKCDVRGVNIWEEFNGTFSIDRTPKHIALTTQKRWKEGNIVEHDHLAPIVPRYNHNQLLPYETYMQALPICEEWETGSVFVFFPPEGSEDNELHTHPISDRIITVAKGSGWFYCVRGSRLYRYPLFAGTRVWMPRGKLHTFFAGSEGLVVESIHNPYVPVNHPKCLFAPAPDKLHYDLSQAITVTPPKKGGVTC